MFDHVFWNLVKEYKIIFKNKFKKTWSNQPSS